MKVYVVTCESCFFDTFNVVGVYSTLDDAKYAIFENLCELRRYDREFDNSMTDTEFNNTVQKFLKGYRESLDIYYYYYDIEEHNLN